MTWKMTVGPLRVAVHKVPAEQRTEGGLYIPELAQEKQTRGVVAAVGVNVSFCAVGDVIAYDNFVGDISVNGKEVVILDEDQVLAKLEQVEPLAVPAGLRSGKATRSGTAVGSGVAALATEDQA